MGSLFSGVMFHLLRSYYDIMYGMEEKPLDTKRELVNIQHEAIDNIYNRPKVAMIVCKPDTDHLPDFCMRLWNPDEKGITLVTGYRYRSWKHKKIRWKRRKKT